MSGAHPRLDIKSLDESVTTHTFEWGPTLGSLRSRFHCTDTPLPSEDYSVSPPVDPAETCTEVGPTSGSVETVLEYSYTLVSQTVLSLHTLTHVS